MDDVIIIGGSYAGLAAALQLGRARRKVLVIDGGQRRNRFATRSHGFLCHDGERADEIAAKGRANVLAYPTVSWREAVVSVVHRRPDGFAVRAGSEELACKRLVLATGVADELPPVPGLAERWGKSVFHCPYCHGYEIGMGRVGALASMPASIHHALLVSQWAAPGQTTLFLNGAFEPDAADLEELAARGIQLERALVAGVEGDAPSITALLRDGRRVELDGLFVLSRSVINNDFVAQLGCELETGPMGSFIKTDATKQTTVPGVFACGDVALPMPAVALAVADGTRAGAGAHQSLVFAPRA